MVLNLFYKSDKFTLKKSQSPKRVLAFFFTLCALIPHTPTWAASLVTVNQLVGELWTCTCFMRPHGGVHRILKYLEQEKKQNPNLLILSNGNLVLSPFETDDGAKWSKKSALLATAFKRLGASAINVSYADLKMGLSEVKKLGADGKIPWVSTNIVDKNSKPLFSPFIDINQGAEKFRIYAFTDAKMHTSKEYTVLDVKKTFQAELSKLEKDRIPIVLIDSYATDLGLDSKGAKRDLIVVGGYPYDEETMYYTDTPKVYSLVGGAKVKKVPRLDFDVKDDALVNPKYSTKTLDKAFDKGAPLKKELDALAKDLGI